MITNYVGELVQHDTSNHVWAPLTDVPWYLITSVDDCSRKILYGELWEKESSLAHITAAKAVVTGYGCPLKYYVDRHSIFKFTEREASMHRQGLMTEDEATVQWKEVLGDLRIEVVYALSPAAKGKVERPYRWLQDHLVRVCVREGVTKIEQAREVLYEEIHQYNHRRVHSTTTEVPDIRFQRLVKEGRSMFSSFVIRPPLLTIDDIFCLRWKRVVNPYRKILVYGNELPVHDAPPRSEVEIRVSFDMQKRLAKLRLWYKNRLVGEYLLKEQDLKKVQF